MEAIVIGLNHKTAPVAIREGFSLSEEQIRNMLKHLRTEEYEDVLECVVLSTCNRTELYAVVVAGGETQALVRQLFLRMAGRTELEDEYLYYFQDDACIRHLFRVAASLDSLVIGEGQILSQVKKAYAMAKDVGMTGTVLNTMFHRAIKTGKRVRAQTRIAYSAVSVSYAAVEQAKKVVGDLTQSKVLILGAGEMSELTARHLQANGVRSVIVSNRNYQRACEFAEKFRGVAVPFDDFWQAAVESDIIITSTGAPHYIIRAWDMAHLIARRKGKPLIVIDIAVPRDVEPEVAAISGVELYNIDDLEAVVEANLKERSAEAAAAEQIIAEEEAALVQRFRYLAFRPTMAKLTDKGERIRQFAMRRAITKLPDMTAEELRVVENLSRVIVRKLLRDPIIGMHQAAGRGQEEYYLEAISRLFLLDDWSEERVSDGGEKGTCYRYAGK